MAIAFVRARPLSRAKGQSIVACAAYRACEQLHDEYYGKDHDYSKKSGHVAGGLVLPEGVTKTREELWNLVEEFEKRCDARLGKEILVAHPKEFTDEDNIILAQGIAKILAEEHKPDGTVDHYPLQWDLHGPHIESVIDEEGNFVLDEKGTKKLQSNDNNHGHYMVSERPWDFETGTFSKKKDRNRNTKEWIATKKLEIGELMNSMLRAKGLPEVDFRSWEERNAESVAKTGKELDRPQVHQGPAKTNKERKRRRKLARKKRDIDNEIKLAEAELKKMNIKAKAKNKSARKTNNQVPVVGNLYEDISKNVDANLAKKQDVTTIVAKSSSRLPQQSVLPPSKYTKSEKPQQPVRRIPDPMPKPARQHMHSNSGPDHKCLFCIPDGSDRCKFCKFREDELGEEHKSGYSR